MSVLATPVVTFYQAPLGISSSKVTMEGSWSASHFKGHMNPRVLFRMRLHTWKQQYKSKVAAACLDWIIIYETSSHSSTKNMLILKLSDKNFSDCLQNETFMKHIQTILDNRQSIYNVHTTINNYTQEI
jgi:hypothetical protein